ncbi:hypothetical protein [uncultured Bacteroides sp.]|uniref:hypothetical protein n=1 Tax=uncultured Bacteroides sp. TaxID=162156 RepID=UPI00261FF617|nr:hypothetical protein [uncultured Bacteroides sp.]
MQGEGGVAVRHHFCDQVEVNRAGRRADYLCRHRVGTVRHTREGGGGNGRAAGIRQADC